MDAQNASAIAVDQLVKRYKGVAAVDGITFRLAPGTVTGLLGGNGAGKTTTIAMIMILRPRAVGRRRRSASCSGACRCAINAAGGARAPRAVFCLSRGGS